MKTTKQFQFFEGYAFEFGTQAKKALHPKRISEYLSVVFKNSGHITASCLLDYVVIVRSQALLINTRYYTFIKDSDEVQEAFDAFNEDYQQYITDELITQTDYEPGKAALPERPAVDISPKQKTDSASS